MVQYKFKYFCATSLKVVAIEFTSYKCTTKTQIIIILAVRAVLHMLIFVSVRAMVGRVPSVRPAGQFDQ